VNLQELQAIGVSGFEYDTPFGKVTTLPINSLGPEYHYVSDSEIPEFTKGDVVKDEEGRLILIARSHAEGTDMHEYGYTTGLGIDRWHPTIASDTVTPFDTTTGTAGTTTLEWRDPHDIVIRREWWVSSLEGDDEAFSQRRKQALYELFMDLARYVHFERIEDPTADVRRYRASIRIRP
jgi:hypothetical protein